MYLNDVKVLLGITDDLQDDLLNVIEKITIQHFKQISKLTEIPEDLEFVILEVMVKRFNRVGAEGMTSKNIEGASINFSQSDFNDYTFLKKSGIKIL